MMEDTGYQGAGINLLVIVSGYVSISDMAAMIQ